MKVDLRSDTVTKPTPEMLEAMMCAAVGDDVYKEDPSVNALEEKLATMFGKEEALFFPSGSMANQAAIKLHTNPGEQLIADHYAHVYNYEGGGVSFNSGVSCKLLVGERGRITYDQVQEAINPPDFYHSPKTSLVCIENTTNKGGGACYDFSEIERIKEVCRTHRLGYHLDGARIWNALVEKKERPLQYGAVFDTISVCLSKGLGAPIGSVLLGDSVIMKEAIRVRKVLGGGMRQVGYMAAAGLYALEHHIDRLAEDHKKAKELEETLKKASFVSEVAPVDTNIVIFKIKGDAQKFIADMEAKGVLFYGMGEGKLRFVTHLDYTQEQHNYVLKLLKK
ncbi:threonine aldolase family protein [Aquimarina hainanensis]|uniref:Threonine aldolase family protein n=1 Tax=Aquimarina hainanensis TaxID=1578017 RepID=A0ABW5NF25_9FLAO|nr:GntG family PLP-dependent aldolase [Aquimarina sp. TRL1]QKX06353.1 threonine aldolase [Aquimarina sp. TRL1]